VRVFLDTNVLVSALATRGLCSDVLEAVLVDHEFILGEAVLTEVQRVLTQKFGISPGLARELDEFLRREAVVIADARRLGLTLRDPADIPVLEQAIAGRVDVVVTGDRDLLDVASELPIRVLSPRGFWEHLRLEDEDGE
jgi:putative PIN family toxin of toxin-antitoxin system